MKENPLKGALENLARAVPEDISLLPGILARIERKSIMQTFRAKPMLMIFAVLFALAILTSVVYAIGRATEYIPGVGLIDGSALLRVLEKPVSVTRDGVTLTVEQVVLSADKTVVIYKVEGIPNTAYSSNENVEGSSSYSSSVAIPLEATSDVAASSLENNDVCLADNRLQLPDGSIVSIRSSGGSGWISGFENRSVYDPIPTNVNEATFLMSCVYGTAPGKLPENWQVPLRFVSAPPDMVILPVVDVVSSESMSSETESAVMLEKVIETDSGYILIGKFRSIGLPPNAMAQGISEWAKITDANGQTVDAIPANNIEPSNVFGECPWGYEIDGKQHAWPLTLTFDSVNALFVDKTTEFEFDAGIDPQVGQKWILNQDLQIASYSARLISIERTSNGYSFIIKADPDVTGISAEIKDFPYTSSTGGNDGFGKGDLYSNIEYEGEPPSGKLTIQLGWLMADIHGPWQVQWSPENMPPTP